MSAPEIALGDLTDPRVLRLLDNHIADMHAVSPPESVHALDVSGLTHPSVTFWAVTDIGAVLGCVALKELDPGELKWGGRLLRAGSRPYAGYGFTATGTFADYLPNPFSVFMTPPLTA